MDEASMKISVFDGVQLKDVSIDELGSYFGCPTWISVVDPSLQDLGRLVEVLGLPGYSLIGDLRSNYPHVDTYAEYTKFFSWYLIHTKRRREFSFLRCPIVVFTNNISVITITQSRTETHERVVEGLNAPILARFSPPARVIYIIMTYLLDDYERYADEFERYTDRLEGAVPPWPKEFYIEASGIRREASRLLRLIKHFRIMAESLVKRNIKVTLSEEETRILDSLYDRAVSVEETTETMLETVRDLISFHLDAISHDMNVAMRLLAAMTVIVAVPSVIGSLFGMNLIGNPWPWTLWQVLATSLLLASFIAIYFYRKGWIRSH